MPTALEPEVFARLKEALQRIASRYPNPDRAQSAIAKELDVDASTINRLMRKPGSGGSLALVRRVANYLNEPVEGIIFGAIPPQPMRKLRELPGFDEAFADALRRVKQEHPSVTLEDLEVASDTRAKPEPAKITAGLLVQLALARRSHTLPPKTVPRAKRVDSPRAR